ncbi:MAG: hypothetical protein OXS28_19265 [Gammaproteobacteria bacterium]|nr:hypothetical protein [Gammaproteobacteria bacterium]
MNKVLLALLLLIVLAVVAPPALGALGLLLLFVGVPMYVCWLMDGLFSAARNHLDRR